jgi:hypothetical protein
VKREEGGGKEEGKRRVRDEPLCSVIPPQPSLAKKPRARRISRLGGSAFDKWYKSAIFTCIQNHGAMEGKSLVRRNKTVLLHCGRARQTKNSINSIRFI